MKIDQYCYQQRCNHVEFEKFLARFRVVRVCQRQLGFFVSSIQSALPHNSPPALFILYLLNSDIHLSTIGNDAILYFCLHILARGPAYNETLQQAIVANNTNLSIPCLLGRN